MSSWFEFEYYIQSCSAHLFNILSILETSYVVIVKVSLIEKVRCCSDLHFNRLFKISLVNINIRDIR